VVDRFLNKRMCVVKRVAPPLASCPSDSTFVSDEEKNDTELKHFKEGHLPMPVACSR
jgi:hypothetical protein